MAITFASYNNQTIYTSRVSAFLFCLRKETPAKKRQTRGFTPSPPQRRAAVHSLRLSVGSSAHSPVNSLRSNNTGNVAEAPPVADEARRCWRKTRSITPAPRAIGDYVLRGLCGVLLCKPFSPLKKSYQTLRRGYCKSDYRNQLVTCFYLAMAKVIDKFQFANDRFFETILSKFASIAFLLLFFNCIELILTQEYN